MSGSSPADATGAVDPGGPVVVVTGGTRGIGRAIALRFLTAGAAVTVCGRRPADPVEAGGRVARQVSMDVRDPAAAQALVDDVVERHGRLDVWVNNAGGTPPSDPLTVSPRFNAAIIDLNLTAPLNAALAAGRVMRIQPDGGTVLFISSVAATVPDPAAPAYAAAKAGVRAAVTALAGALGPRVRVNGVEVGLIGTADADAFYADGVPYVPAGRMGTPDDVAGACLLLADRERGAFITGAMLACHGGLPMPAFMGGAFGAASEHAASEHAASEHAASEAAAGPAGEGRGTTGPADGAARDVDRTGDRA